MPKNTHTAVDPNGVVHKRTSQNREYAFTVVARESESRDRQFAETIHKVDLSNYDHYAACLDGTSRFLVKRFYMDDAAHKKQCERDIERARNELGGATSAQEYAEAQRQKRLAAHEARVASGFYEQYVNLGWASRLDLAQKVAGLAEARGSYVDVVILPAEMERK